VLSHAEIVDAVRRRLFSDGESELLAVYVFGSTVTGGERPASDLDLAFLAARSPSADETFSAAQELASLAGRDVDLVDLARASTVLRAEVVGTGRKIHEADPLRVGEFEMTALSDYARLNEERREAVDAFLARYRG
jgi:predicted nucleotidyltransferase